LIRQEHRKAHGIINGIDVEVWNPATDSMLDFNFSVEDATKAKRKIKKNSAKNII
jgi:starch synthase